VSYKSTAIILGERGCFHGFLLRKSPFLLRVFCAGQVCKKSNLLSLRVLLGIFSLQAIALVHRFATIKKPSKRIMTYPIYGGPVSQSSVADLQQNFQWLYALCNPVQNLPAVCNWQNFKNQLNINPAWATANGQGVLMFYMLETNVGGSYYSYAIVNGERDAMGNFQPTPGATYFSLLPGGGIKTYTTPADLLYMNQCILNYDTSIQIRNFLDLVNGVTVPVASLINHPRKAFLSAETVWKFFDDNSGSITGTTDICLLNGAEFTDVISGPVDNQYKAQSPILVYMNGSSSLLSDECPDMNKPYLDKALDNSAKCPPRCT
jgi:hypothetical protein